MHSWPLRPFAGALFDDIECSKDLISEGFPQARAARLVLIGCLGKLPPCFRVQLDTHAMALPATPLAEPRTDFLDGVARVVRLHRASGDLLHSALQFLSPCNLGVRLCVLVLETEQQLVRKPGPLLRGEPQRVGEQFIRSCHGTILLPAGAECSRALSLWLLP